MMDDTSRILEHLAAEEKAYRTREKNHAYHRRYPLAAEYWARWHTIGLLIGWIHKEFSVGAIDEPQNRGVVTRCLARRFITAREDLLTAMYADGVTRVELADGNIVEWDESIGIGGELYAYCNMPAVPNESSPQDCQ